MKSVEKFAEEQNEITLKNYEDWRDGITREKEVTIQTMDGLIIDWLEKVYEDLQERNKCYHTRNFPIEELESVIDFLKLELKFKWERATHNVGETYRGYGENRRRVHPIVTDYEDYYEWQKRLEKEMEEEREEEAREIQEKETARDFWIDLKIDEMRGK